MLVRKPITFNLIHGPQWAPVQRRRHARRAAPRSPRGLFLDAYAIRELRLPAYRGAVGGMLPVYADGVHPHALPDATARSSSSARAARASTTRSATRSRSAPAAARGGSTGATTCSSRRSPRAGATASILEIESTPAAGTPNADEIGNHGALKTPLRSFRFGEDRKGGTA